MNCKYCQREMPDDSRFCPYCGKDNLEGTEGMPPLETEEMPAFDTAAQVEEILDSEGEAVVLVSDEEPREEVSQVEEAVASPQVKKMKRFAILSGCLAVLALLGTLLFFGVKEGWAEEWDLDFKQIFGIREDSLLGNDSYSVSDKKAASKRNDVVASFGESQLTNGQLQVYYWMEVMSFLENYGYYLSYFGMDYTQPLDEQTSWDEEMGTWQQYFLACALESWQGNQALAMEANANGFQLEGEHREYLDGLRETMETAAAEDGFESVDAMLQTEMGPGCTVDDYLAYMESYYTGYMYFTKLYDALDPTDEEVEAYFAENEADFSSQSITKESGKYYAIRNILIAPEGGTKDDEGNITYTDDQWAACQQKAQTLLDQWKAGEATEDSFTALVKENSADENTKDSGGLYAGFTAGDMKELYGEPYEDWCVSEERKPGDCELLKTAEGYQLVYFVESQDIWYAEAYDALISELSTKIVQDAVAKYELDVNYKKIVLGVVELG